MYALGRVMGHSMGGLFMLLGAMFLLAGLNDGFTSWLDANSTCSSGICDDSSARSTFVLLGGSFFAGGLITSLATEFAVRKTRKVINRVSAFAATGDHSAESVSDFLEDFGIDLGPSKLQVARIQHHTIDLRGQRQGEVPADPASLSAYLKSRGISIEEDLLRNATVVDSGRTVLPRPEAHPATSLSSDPSSMFGTPLRREETSRESATIVRKHDRGAVAGNQRLLELELEVTPAGKVPYRVTVASLVRESLAGLLIEGSALSVRVDANDQNEVTIDWSEN